MVAHLNYTDTEFCILCYCVHRSVHVRSIVRLLDIPPINQLALSQVADWSTRRLDDLRTIQFADHECLKIAFRAIINPNFLSAFSAS